MTYLLAEPGKFRDLFVAIRDAGGRGATPTEIQAATGHSANSFAPALWELTRAGYVVAVGTRGVSGLRDHERDRPQRGQRERRPWPMPVYVTARNALMLGPAIDRKEVRP